MSLRNQNKRSRCERDRIWRKRGLVIRRIGIQANVPKNHHTGLLLGTQEYTQLKLWLLRNHFFLARPDANIPNYPRSQKYNVVNLYSLLTVIGGGHSTYDLRPPLQPHHKYNGGGGGPGGTTPAATAAVRGGPLSLSQNICRIPQTGKPWKKSTQQLHCLLERKSIFSSTFYCQLIFAPSYSKGKMRRSTIQSRMNQLSQQKFWPVSGTGSSRQFQQYPTT